MAPPTELTGQLGRYRILHRIGAGGMGSVYLAEDTHIGRNVALKVPHFAPDDPPSVIERFYREARLAARLDHPNLCHVHDVGEIDGVHFFTMPFIEGVPLSKAIDPERPWESAKAVDLVRRIATAVGLLHRNGIVHRDLKPSNIIVRGSGDPVLMDFGLARSFVGQGPRLTTTGTPMGSPGYMAPEQVVGSRDIGPASDVYGLGIILYELLTGCIPFDGPLAVVFAQILNAPVAPPSSVRPGIDPRLDAVCLKATSKKPEDRQPSMEVFADELAAAMLPIPVATAVLVPPQDAPAPGPTFVPPPPTPAPTIPTNPEISCPKCAKVLKVPPGMGGRKVKCPRCGTPIGRVPDAPPEAAGRRDTVAQSGVETSGAVPAASISPRSRRRRVRNILLVIGLTLTVLLTAAGLGIYVFVLKKNNAPELDRVPRDAVGFVHLRVADAIRNEAGSKLVESLLGAVPQREDGTPVVDLKEIDRVTLVVAEATVTWLIVKTIHSCDRTRILDHLGSTREQSRQEKTYRVGLDGTAVAFLDDETFVVGKAAAVERCLDLPKKPAPGPLDEAVRTALTGKHLVTAAFDGKPITRWLAESPTAGKSSMAWVVERAVVTLEARQTFEVELKLDMKDDAAARNAESVVANSVAPFKTFFPLLKVEEEGETKRTLRMLEGMKTRRNQSRLTLLLKLDAEDLARLVEKQTRPDGPSPAASAAAKNNLKRIAQGMLLYAESQGLIPQAIVDPNLGGQPLLSWRVAILPYIGEKDLFDQVRLDEAWDSPANKLLHERMPKVFDLPGSGFTSSSRTLVQMPTGPGAPFVVGSGAAHPRTFKDGAANTILLVEGATPVNWMEPSDLVYVRETPRAGLGKRRVRGTAAVMADGTVLFVSPRVSDETLRRAFDPGDGRPLGSDWPDGDGR